MADQTNSELRANANHMLARAHPNNREHVMLMLPARRVLALLDDLCDDPNHQTLNQRRNRATAALQSTIVRAASPGDLFWLYDELLSAATAVVEGITATK